MYLSQDNEDNDNNVPPPTLKLIVAVVLWNIDQMRIQNPVTHFRMELFAKIFNGFHLLTLFAKNAILDV